MSKRRYDPEAAHGYYYSKAVQRRAFFEWLKDQPCHDCDGRFAACSMDFDHVRGIKNHTPGN